MKFKMCTFALLAGLGSAILASYAHAQNSTLYVAHAAPGRAISSTTNPEYPVDFSANGICLAKGIAFGDIRGPLTGPAGTYNVKFTIANSAFPCFGTPVFSASVSLAAGSTYIGVLTLDASNHVTGQIYASNLTALPAASLSRIEIVNATTAPLTAALSNTQGPVGTVGVSPSTIMDVDLFAGLFTGTILDANKIPQVGPVNVQLEQRNMYLYVLGGSATNFTVQLIGPKAIRGIF
jgi:hypothetical protein